VFKAGRSALSTGVSRSDGALTLDPNQYKLKADNGQGLLRSAPMQFPREYVAYMARQVLKRLAAAGLIQFELPDYVEEVMTQVTLEELAVEDRINGEVRQILEQHNSEMKQMGASYEEMFKKVKRQLVRDRKAVL
jgi:hypothetical protein